MRLSGGTTRPAALFYHPSTGRPLLTRAIATRIRHVIEEADPGKAPHTHDLRGLAASLAFLRTHSLSRVLEGGQWKSASSFVTRYLSHNLQDTPCVALGTTP